MAAEAPVDWTSIFNTVKESVFLVLVEPKVGMVDRLQAVADRVGTVSDGSERAARVRDGCSSTGFVLLSSDTALYIVTTAHGLDHLFKASDPLQESTMNMFDVSVLCHHFEHDYQQDGLPGERKYATGFIVDADCQNDILIVGVWKNSLKNLVDDGACARNHNSLVITEGSPSVSKECMLVSWPSMHGRVSRGWTSTSRTVATFSDPNPFEYTMPLLEAHMTTDEESTGAPLVGEDGKVIGMLHGGFGGTHSYFVDARHLRDYLL
ncbi:hypothetical protein ACQ4PT_035372 [Festuca glaucescens]